MVAAKSATPRFPRPACKPCPMPVTVSRVHGSFNKVPDGCFMPERSFRLLLWSLALTGLFLDQASKYSVFSWLQGVEGNTYVLFQSDHSGGFQLVAQFEPGNDGTLVPHVNHGALFGFLRNHKTLANSGFALVSLIAAAAIIFWSTQKSTARDLWLCAALG